MLLPGCLVLQEPGARPEALPAGIRAELLPGSLPWDPLPCDPTRATSRGSDAWLGYRTTLAGEDGRYVAFALGDPTTGPAQDVAVDGPDMRIFGEPFARWPTEEGDLLVKDGRALYLKDEPVTAASLTAVVDQAVQGLGLTVGERSGDGTLEVLVTAPGHEPRDEHGFLRAGVREHSIVQEEWSERSVIEVDLRPWPAPGASWISMEAAAAIAGAHLRCWQRSGGFSPGLERPRTELGYQGFLDGELVWRFSDGLDWRDGRKVDCDRDDTLPHVVGVSVDARTGAVVEQTVWANGEGPCYLV